MTDSKIKHTPGPWTRGYGNYVYVGNRPSEHGPLVATCYPLNGSLEELEQAFANAQLIAAAPALLAACEEFVRKCEAGEARSTHSYAQMKAAIVQAKKDAS